MKKKLYAILAFQLLLGSLAFTPALAAEADSSQNISPYYGCRSERLSDSDDDWYCGRGRGCHGGYYGRGGCYYDNR